MAKDKSFKEKHHLVFDEIKPKIDGLGLTASHFLPGFIQIEDPWIFYESIEEFLQVRRELFNSTI